MPLGTVKHAEVSSAGAASGGGAPYRGNPATNAKPIDAGTTVVGVLASTPPSLPPSNSMTRVTAMATQAAKAPESNAVVKIVAIV